MWDLVELPDGRQPVGSKWVFKTDAGGKFEHYKARLVAQGFSQKYGSDYDETIVTYASPIQHGLKPHQVDVTTAFLNGELKEEVFMQQPESWPGASGLYRLKYLLVEQS